MRATLLEMVRTLALTVVTKTFYYLAISTSWIELSAKTFSSGPVSAAFSFAFASEEDLFVFFITAFNNEGRDTFTGEATSAFAFTFGVSSEVSADSPV